ncbi:MAG: tripartite tricarboxylate transporter permease [Candidatus Rokubacteria bacterium]|nr:tripartite tricarboxylate transporter permease [Candidatus Rokubacteria bacterium]
MGNLVLLILNLPLVGLFANLLRIPYRVLYPLVVAFCVLGVYAVNGSPFEVWIMLVMGLAGYALRKLGYEPAPLVIGLVLAPIFEMSLRQSLILSDGSYTIFLQRPLAASLLGLVGALLILALASLVRRLRTAGPGPVRD